MKKRLKQLKAADAGVPFPTAKQLRDPEPKVVKINPARRVSKGWVS
jgi:hypothetical protein